MDRVMEMMTIVVMIMMLREMNIKGLKMMKTSGTALRVGKESWFARINNRRRKCIEEGMKRFLTPR